MIVPSAAPERQFQSGAKTLARLENRASGNFGPGRMSALRMKKHLAIAAFAALSVVPGRSAHACLSEVEMQMELFNASPAGQIAIAEKELEAGKPEQAASRVRASFPNVRSLDAKAQPLALRAERIYALAVVRTEGKLDAKSGWAPWGHRC